MAKQIYLRGLNELFILMDGGDWAEGSQPVVCSAVWMVQTRALFIKSIVLKVNEQL